MEAIYLAAEAISRDFGSLDDLPAELANTIANIYFKFFLLAFGQVFSTLKSKLQRDPTEAFIESSADLTSTVDHLPEMIKQLREMRDAGRKDLYAYWTTFTLDKLKYDLPNAEDKSQIRRKFERLFKTPDEISNLYAQIRLAMVGQLEHFEIFDSTRR